MSRRWKKSTKRERRRVETEAESVFCSDISIGTRHRSGGSSQSETSRSQRLQER